MPIYNFYIGTGTAGPIETYTGDDGILNTAIGYWQIGMKGLVRRITGVYRGETEHSLIVPLNIHDDITAQRLAAAVAGITGNVSVMVVRDHIDTDNRSFVSPRRYRAARLPVDPAYAEYATIDGDNAYEFAPLTNGSSVVFIVTIDGTLHSL